MGVKFGMEEGTFGPLLHAKFHSHRCNVSPLRGEKPQNRPLSKLNTGRFALRAMLPAITADLIGLIYPTTSPDLLPILDVGSSGSGIDRLLRHAAEVVWGRSAKFNQPFNTVAG